MPQQYVQGIYHSEEESIELRKFQEFRYKEPVARNCRHEIQ